MQKYQFHFSSAPNAFEFVPHNHRTSCRTNRDGIEYNFILNVPTIHNSTHTMEKDRRRSRRAFERTWMRSKNSPSYLSLISPLPSSVGFHLFMLLMWWIESQFIPLCESASFSFHWGVVLVFGLGGGLVPFWLGGGNRYGELFAVSNRRRR